jgi:hypothetical protein
LLEVSAGVFRAWDVSTSPQIFDKTKGAQNSTEYPNLERWELTFVNQNQAQIIPGGEAFIDLSECWGEVEAA